MVWVMVIDLDVEQLRSETPGVSGVVHFNNAGSALPPNVVLETTIGHLRREAAIGGYEAAAEAAPRLEAVYTSVAKLLNGSAREIAIVENATKAWDAAVYSFPFAEGDRVLTGRAEYASNAIAFLQLQKQHNLDVVLIDDDEHGQIDLNILEQELQGGAAMVSIVQSPTNGGLINPAAAVGELCQRHGAFFMLDACQAAGQLPLDVQALQCDALSATGRKFLRGPRGTGFLYVRDEWISRLTPACLDLHSATWTTPTTYEIADNASRFENWECNYAGKLGLGAAVDYALALGVENTWPRVTMLADRLRAGLQEIPGVAVHDKGIVRGGIVTFAVEGMPSDQVSQRLRVDGINTSVSPALYAQYDLPARGLSDLVRASVHYYNTNEEIDRVLASLTGER
jgi:cysteine desulfurase / selenocysteine lyase